MARPPPHPGGMRATQGFPIGYTLIPGTSSKKRKGEDLSATIDYLMSLGVPRPEAPVLAHSPDGPRYKALGTRGPCRWRGGFPDALMLARKPFRANSPFNPFSRSWAPSLTTTTARKQVLEHRAGEPAGGGAETRAGLHLARYRSCQSRRFRLGSTWEKPCGKCRRRICAGSMPSRGRRRGGSGCPCAITLIASPPRFRELRTENSPPLRGTAGGGSTRHGRVSRTAHAACMRRKMSTSRFCMPLRRGRWICGRTGAAQ